jgi:hypothetical protein
MTKGGSMDVLTLDGRMLTVTGNPHGFLGPWGFLGWLHGPHGSVRLHTGLAGSLERSLEQAGALPAMRVRSASLGAARVRSYEDTEAAETHFAWAGAWHEVKTFVKGSGLALDGFVGLLGTVRISDSRQGVWLSPKPGSATRLTGVVGANSVPLVCGLSVRATADAAGMVPRWAGRTVAGGELWRDAVAEGGLEVGVLANPSAVTVLQAGAAQAAAMAALAETLSVTLGGAG